MRILLTWLLTINHFVRLNICAMRGEIYYRVFRTKDGYIAMASDGTHAVMNCFGNTPEMAKEMARVRLLNAKNPDVS